MSRDKESRPFGTRSARIVVPPTQISGGRKLLALLFLAAAAISSGSAHATPDKIILPIEIVGNDGATVSRTFVLPAKQAESARSLWLRIHGLRYAGQASVQVNLGQWLSLNNETVTIAEPGR